MKKLAFLFPLILLVGCATVKQNIDARTNLYKCKFDFAGIELKGLKFGSGIAVDALDFDALVKVTNNTDTDVAIDHVNSLFFLDKNQILGLDHNVFTRIPVTESKIDRISVEIPFKGILNQIGKKPETITAKAKLWLTILVGKDTWEVPIPFMIEITVPIPYDQINSLVEQEKKRLEAETAKEAARQAEVLRQAESARQADVLRQAESAKQAAKKAAEEAASKIKSPF